jgi:DNA-binding SARP family transcriptional activator
MSDIRTLNDQGLGSLPPVLISLLGFFKLTLCGQPAPISSGSKSEQLLTCLALARQRGLLRAELLERIWPQCDAALAGQCLNSLTHQLNKLVHASGDGLGLIAHDNGYYYLNVQAGVGIDVDYFDAWYNFGKRLLQKGETTNGVAYCEQALMLYHGDLCGDSTIYIVIERERLRATFLELLTCLADHYYRHGEPEASLSYLHRLLVQDPCREDAHRLAMRCYMQRNLRAQALRQYRICCQALAVEFEAGPEPATIALFNQIRLDPSSVSFHPTASFTIS